MVYSSGIPYDLMVEQGLLGFWTIVRLQRLLMKMVVINHGGFQPAQMVVDHHSLSRVVLNQQVAIIVGKLKLNFLL